VVLGVLVLALGVLSIFAAITGVNNQGNWRPFEGLFGIAMTWLGVAIIRAALTRPFAWFGREGVTVQVGQHEPETLRWEEVSKVSLLVRGDEDDETYRLLVVTDIGVRRRHPRAAKLARQHGSPSEYAMQVPIEIDDLEASRADLTYWAGSRHTA
jgi:hypothetical protein